MESLHSFLCFEKHACSEIHIDQLLCWHSLQASVSTQGRIQEVEIIDIPGHPRVRGEAQNYFSKVSRIVFMVDAVDFMTQKSSLAEHLFEVGVPISEDLFAF